jgi:hypothetical protein
MLLSSVGKSVLEGGAPPRRSTGKLSEGRKEKVPISPKASNLYLENWSGIHGNKSPTTERNRKRSCAQSVPRRILLIDPSQKTRYLIYLLQQIWKCDSERRVGCWHESGREKKKTEKKASSREKSRPRRNFLRWPSCGNWSPVNCLLIYYVAINK